jgi:hypothetical protein
MLKLGISEVKIFSPAQNRNWVFQKLKFSPLPKTEVGYFRTEFFFPTAQK